MSAECGTRNAERPHYTTFRSQGKNDKCGTRSAEYGTTLFECGVRNAERGVRNDLTTLRFVHKENYISTERGVRNAERPHYTTFRSQGKVHITNYLDFVICAVGRQNHIIQFFYHFAYVRALLDLDFWMQYATKIPQQEEFTRGK